MATSGEQINLDKIDDLIEMSEVMKLLKIPAKGLTTLDQMKSRVKEELSKRENTCGWSPGQAFSNLSNNKENDDRKRERLAELYTKVSTFLDPLDTTIVTDKVKEGMKQHISQLKKKEYYLLVAGETSSGKSRLLNLIIGEKILPYSHLSTTSVICELKFGDEPKIVVHFKEEHPEFGKSKTIPLKKESYLQQISTYVHKKNDREKGSVFEKVEVFWPNSLLKEIVIVDSPGIGESPEMDDMVFQYLPEAFAFIYVINSANAGGVQPDRLVNLLNKVQEVTLGRKQNSCEEGEKDEMEVSTPLQQQLLSKCAMFVCNKWDQVPKSENENVKAKVIGELKKFWPGFDPKSQIIYMSAKECTKLQKRGCTPNELSSLMEGMNSMIEKSIEARLDLHWGWLDDKLRRINYKAYAFLRNASRDREDVEKKMEENYRSLNVLEEKHQETMNALRKCFDEQVNESVRLLHEYLSSDEVVERFTSWEKVPEEGSSWQETNKRLMSEISSRLTNNIALWEENRKVLNNAQSSLVNSFKKHYLNVMVELRNLEDAILVGDDPDIFASQYTEKERKKETVTRACGVAFSFAAVIGVAAWSPMTAIFVPLSCLLFLQGSIQELWDEWQFKKNKCSFMAQMSKNFLKNFAQPQHLKPFLQHCFKNVQSCLDELQNKLPKVIEECRINCRDLKEDKRSKNDKESTYRPILEESQKHRTEVASFGIEEILSVAILSDDVDWQKPLGSGSFSIVYQGKLKIQGAEEMVALKEFKDPLPDINRTKIAEEVYVLRNLRHRHIVRFHGLFLSKNEEKITKVALVMEKCAGDVKSRIFGNPKSIPGLSKDPAVAQEVCRWAKEISVGLKYIHDQGIVHRDLKLENILVSHDDIVKIADVGQAKAAKYITGTFVGTPIYMAPEVFHRQKYDSTADIYSLGLMLWEMWYGQQAFSDILTVNPQLTMPELFEWVDKGHRPKDTKFCNKPPPGWEQLITQCWNEDPDIRPTAAHCAREMIMQQMEMDPELDAVRIDYGVLKMEGEESNFGVGAFGPVYYQGTMERQKDVQTGVTVELYKEDTVIEDVWTIMKLMWPLRSLKHKHIVQCHGITLCKKEDILTAMLVMDRCKETLRSYLREHPESVPSKAQNSVAAKSEVWKWAMDIADGLAYIHGRKIIHRDLKMENIWLSEQKTAKITGIGMSKLAEDIKGDVAETTVYMAPEVLRGQEYDSKADIYSLGLMLWEMWYGDWAFKGIPVVTREEVLLRVDKDDRPVLVETESPETPLSQWNKLVEHCWNGKPKERPSAECCIRQLEFLKKAIDPCNGSDQQVGTSV